MNEYLPVMIAAGLVAGIYLQRRLLHAVQPLRLELAEKGETILAHPKITDQQRGYVRFMLDSAFGNRMFLLFGLIAVPFVSILLIVRPSYIKKSLRGISGGDSEVKATIHELSKLHDRITFFHNPLLMVLIHLEILAFIPIAIIIATVIHEAISVVNSEDVMTFIESKEHKVFALVGRHRH